MSDLPSPAPNNPVWVELIQLVPVITLASSFVASGTIDLERAAPLFVAASLLTIPIMGLLLSRRFTLNPILTGTALWLWLGAAGFAIPIAPLADLLGKIGAVGLFVAAALVGVATMATSPAGYLGYRGPPSRVRAGSVLLLLLTASVIAWSWVFRADPRLGGGLPFITLNVARRALILWAMRAPA